MCLFISITMQFIFFIFKEYHCEHCEQSYLYRGDLNKHRRTHYEDGKMYGCSICQMRFKYFLDMNQHLNEHYMEKRAVTGDQPAEEVKNN